MNIIANFFITTNVGDKVFIINSIKNKKTGQMPGSLKNYMV
ncbi:hypothetical protein [Mucilaginibacter sp. HD30]